MSETLLAVEGLCVRYGRVQALVEANLKIEAGSIVSVIGANGAGKSTLLNALMGILPVGGAVTGRVAFEGHSIESLSCEARVRAGIALVPETRELFGTMSVEENLILGGFRFRGQASVLNHELAKVYHRFPRLAERRTQMAMSLSGGERQMLAIGRALMAKPKLLMLDEPSLGLSPRIVAEMFEMIADLKTSNVTVLLVEQNAVVALDLSDFGYVIETGRVVAQGVSRDLKSDRRLAEAYFGVQH